MSDIQQFIHNFKSADNIGVTKEAIEKISPKIKSNKEEFLLEIMKLDIAHYTPIISMILNPIMSAVQSKPRSQFTQKALQYSLAFLSKMQANKVRGVRAEICAIGYYVVECLEKFSFSAPQVCVLLKKAITKVQEEPSDMTPLHRSFAVSCINYKCYTYALPIIQKAYYNINKDLYGITSFDVIGYYYYCGFILAALEEHDKAIENFRKVLCCPSEILHIAHVQSFKKLILCSMIKGIKYSVPKSMQNTLRMMVTRGCSFYCELSDVFFDKNEKKFNELLEMQKMQLVEDHNMGLVEQIKLKIMKMKIAQLRFTYQTITINDIADKLKKKSVDVKTIIYQMIQDGEMSARIDEKNEMITFVTDELDYANIVNELNDQNQRIREVMERVKTTDLDIKTSKEYLRTVIFMEESGIGGMTGAGDFNLQGDEGAEMEDYAQFNQYVRLTNHICTY